MRIADIGGCAVKLNPLFLAVMVLAALTGYLSIFLLSFAVVLLHECCHALAARSFGFAVREVELLPFGGVARIEGLFELDPTAEVVIAAAGPACNLILLMTAVSLDRFLALPPHWITLFIDVNLGMAALNLLPALPLDGGRMLRGLLSRHFDLIKVTRLCSWAGLAAAAGLAGVFLWASLQGSINLSIALMALFFFLASLRELKQAPFLIYKGLSGKRESLKRNDALPVRHIMARQNMELGSLVRRFTPGWYHMVTVVDDECRPLGAIDEEQVIAALYRVGSSAAVGEVAGKRAR
jgi:stage IV sporulation protein FB